MRVSTGLFLGSAHVPTSYPAADGTSRSGNSVGFWACMSPVERALFATISRALQAAHRSQGPNGDEEITNYSQRGCAKCRFTV